MQQTILACQLALLLLLVPLSAHGQTETLPSPSSPSPSLPVPPEQFTEPFQVPAGENDRPPAAGNNTPPEVPRDLGGGFGPGVFDPRLLAIPRSSYTATWFPTERVANEPTHLGYLQEDFSLSVPVYHDGCDTLAVSIRGRNETFSTEAFLPGSQRGFPMDLWALSFGTTWAHQLDNGWITGASLNVGSASDQPFHSINEMTAGGTAFLRIPVGQRDAWLFSLSYSPTAEVAFPIPMAAYIYNPSDQLRVNIGLPFQVMYRPTQDLQLDLSYMLLRTVHAQATYRICDPVRFHVAFDWGNESYFLADRPNVNDRLFYYDKRLSAGFNFTLLKNFTVDLKGGYVFDRFYFEGAQYADKNTNELDIGSGAYLSLQGRFRW